MKFAKLMMVAAAAAFVGCDQAPEEQVTESGMSYIMFEDAPGQTPDSTDVVTFNYKILNAADSIIDNSWERGTPVEVQVGPAQGLGALQEAVFLMSEGDSMQVRVAAEKLYGQRLPPNISEGDTITILLKTEKIQTEEAFMADRQAKEQAMKEEESAVLAQYLEENDIANGIKTESGLVYVIEETGTGATPAAGDEVQVNYTGMLLDGTVFDTSLESAAKENEIYNEQRDYAPFTFTLGQGMVIAGWDEAITLLPVGSKARLYIPSDLAYGPRGAGNLIPPFATLMFDVEVVGISE